jgi:putative tricarboxylic transport membrane protein
VRFNDALLGAFVALFGCGVLYLASRFPELQHFRYGPGFFPSLLALGMIGSGAILVLHGARTWRAEPAVVFGDWARSGRHAASVLLVIGGVAFYVLTADRLGYLPTAAILLFALVWQLWRRPWAALAVAVVGSVLTHQFFVGVLSVPLPWGVLEPWSGALTWR